MESSRFQVHNITMQRAFADYYEMLRVSPNADLQLIESAYEILTQRYQPGNTETGDAQSFASLNEAYQVLRDPEGRASYDRRRRETSQFAWNTFEQSQSAQGVDDERRKRQGILSLLYRRRINRPEMPGMTLREFEDQLGMPAEKLDFAFWFLKESQCIQRTAGGIISITLKGVDAAEELIERRVERRRERRAQAAEAGEASGPVATPLLT
jgi:curved DNA-binding protein CbpA